MTFGTGTTGEVASSFSVSDDGEITCTSPRSWGAAGDWSATTADVAVHWSDGSTRVLTSAFAFHGWTPNDARFGEQWHLENTAQTTNAVADEDVRAVGAWNKGYTGTGVVVGVVDDGLELGHADLAANIVPGSYDFYDDDTDPTRNLHGTSVAGLIGARGGNTIGVVGVAPESSMIGLAMFFAGADIADSWGRDVHLVSNSWGVSSGYGFFDPAITAAFFHGLANGRDGLGTVVLKSSGNGRQSGQQSGHDQLHGLPICVVGGVGSDGQAYTGSQWGPPVLVCAPTQKGVSGFPGPLTTDRTGAPGYGPGDYVEFGGTSASCPIAAGAVALILEANPSLRWMDVLYILGTTARRNDPGHALWQQNAAGHWTSDAYGSGVVDADAGVTAASDFTVRPYVVENQTDNTITAIPDNNPAGVTRTFAVTKSMSEVIYARVELVLTHTYIGDIQVTLTSPGGFTSTLIASDGAFSQSLTNQRMRFLTYRNMTESSTTGNWTLQVSDVLGGDTGTLQSAKLVVGGYE